MSKKVIIHDISEDQGGPHWLSQEGKQGDKPKRTLQEITAEHRARWLAEQKARREREKKPG